MFPVYEEKKKNLHIHLRTSAHASPHLHNSIEFIYITEGTLELGMGQELYHMEEGDFAVIFPDVIHHYQVFSPGENKAVYLWAKPVLIGQFADIVNVVRCLRANRKEKDDNLAVEQAYVQIPGFESQRTFNRVFRERYRMTPREYRTLYKEKYLREEPT